MIKWTISLSKMPPIETEKRIGTLRKIIYLKRRCNRCYIVNVLSSIVNLILHGYSILSHYDLFSQHLDFFVERLTFVAATLLMIIGSVTALNAMSNKFKYWAFVTGKVVMTLAVLITVFSMYGYSILKPSKFTAKGADKLTAEMSYGYPLMYIEDCEAYPDHTFTFIRDPLRRRGRPVVEHHPKEENVIKSKVQQPVMDEAEYLGGAEYDSSNENTSGEPPADGATPANRTAKKKEKTTSPPTTTEIVTYDTYPCPDVLDNVRWFKFLRYMMISFLIATSTCVILSYLGILHLWLISRHKNLILKPGNVQPYEDYDELMNFVRTHGNTEVGESSSSEEESNFDARRQEFEQFNLDLLK